MPESTRDAAVKHVGIRDQSTVVVTMTMVNLSTDSRAAGGQGAAWLRRIGAIVTMGLDALLSAFLVLHVNGASARAGLHPRAVRSVTGAGRIAAHHVIVGGHASIALRLW
jgi:hypothetical protein